MSYGSAQGKAPRPSVKERRMSDTATMNRDEIGAAIAGKAWKDPAFHAAVLANPHKVYEEHVGEPVPHGVTIKVLEDTASTVHFVLPARPPAPGALSDDELESVAGGFAGNTMHNQNPLGGGRRCVGW